ncbi:MAG TPA: hypothetical protein DCG12_03580 [Planctomycetaceae bacterium]|nr:hypothetical protein [Planctomycetaceae bacterium]
MTRVVRQVTRLRPRQLRRVLLRKHRGIRHKRRELHQAHQVILLTRRRLQVHPPEQPRNLQGQIIRQRKHQVNYLQPPLTARFAVMSLNCRCQLKLM